MTGSRGGGAAADRSRMTFEPEHHPRGSSRPRNDEPRLSALDELAFDALIDAGFDLSMVPDSLRERAGAIADLMGLAAGDGMAVDVDSTLVDRTLASIAQADRLSGSRAEAMLVAADEEALDALAAANFHVDGVNATLRERAGVLMRVGALVTAPREGERCSRDLTDRTLARIAATAMEPPAPAVGRPVFRRMADVLSMAAAGLLAASVLWPVLTSWRHQSMKMTCGNNMATVAGAMSTYATDYREQLPVASASLAGPTWWDVGNGPGRSNSANLFQLPRLRYATLRDFACPGNPASERSCRCDASQGDWSCHAEVSYSYHVMFSSVKPQWGERHGDTPMVVLADKSPVVARSRLGQAVNPLENSPNHGGDGQWVMRSDGSGAWLSSPQNGDDNIWMPAVVDHALADARAEMRRSGARVARMEFRLRGDELPTERGNTFVGP